MDDKCTELTIEARFTTRDVWLIPDFELGTGLVDKVARGETNELGFAPRLVKANHGKRLGDLVHVGGLAIKVASRRLVTGLESLNATGFTTYDIEIEHPLIGSEDYSGLAVTGRRGAEDVYQVHPVWPTEQIGIRPTILSALAARGIDAFLVEKDDAPLAGDVE